MRATIYNGIKSICLTEVEKPSVRPGTILVKVLRAGICGTDLHAYNLEGESVGIFPGHEFGHEMVGVIEEIGESVSGFEKGTAVFVNPITFRDIPDGWNSTESADMAGAFSEYVLVEKPEWDVSIFSIPDCVSLDRAALMEPLSVAMNGVLLAHPEKGQKAVVYGAGPIGLGALAALKYLGVEDVVVADSVPLRLEAVKQMGGIPCDITRVPTNQFLMELWGKKLGNMNQDTTDADLVIDCAGYPKSITDFMECAKIGSRLVCIALSSVKQGFSTSDLSIREIHIIGSAGYKAEAIKKVRDMLESGVDVSPMITGRFGLSDIAEAFEKASDSQKNIKVIIRHSR